MVLLKELGREDLASQVEPEQEDIPVSPMQGLKVTEQHLEAMRARMKAAEDRVVLLQSQLDTAKELVVQHRKE
eukprot:4084025-Alexandrium_andersonii.AAC.1